MYNRLMTLYKSGEINNEGLEKAVSLGWIKKEEMQKIIEECM